MNVKINRRVILFPDDNKKKEFFFLFRGKGEGEPFRREAKPEDKAEP